MKKEILKENRRMLQLAGILKEGFEEELNERISEEDARPGVHAYWGNPNKKIEVIIQSLLDDGRAKIELVGEHPEWGSSDPYKTTSLGDLFPIDDVKEGNLEEDMTDPATVAGVAGAATGAVATMAAVLATAVSKYKEIRKSQPDLPVPDAIKQSLTATIQSLSNQHSTRY